MTRIDFYFNANDKFHLACKITAKAYRQRLGVFVCVADVDSAKLIDQILWSDDPTGFIPHCRSTHSLAIHTPILIATNTEKSWHDDVVINLTDRPPETFSRFSRLVEIVSLDGSDRISARERFRFYKDRGYEIYHHDLLARVNASQ